MANCCPLGWGAWRTVGQTPWGVIFEPRGVMVSKLLIKLPDYTFRCPWAQVCRVWGPTFRTTHLMPYRLDNTNKIHIHSELSTTSQRSLLLKLAPSIPTGFNLSNQEFQRSAMMLKVSFCVYSWGLEQMARLRSILIPDAQSRPLRPPALWRSRNEYPGQQAHLPLAGLGTYSPEIDTSRLSD